MNRKGVDIGCLHDPLGDLVQALAAECSPREALNMDSIYDEIAVKHLAFTDDLNGADGCLDLDQGREAVILKNRDVGNSNDHKQ